MGWPEALVTSLGVVQVMFLAWIAQKQAAVKRDLNGHQDFVSAELLDLRSALDVDRISVAEKPRVTRRVFPPET